MVHWIAIVVVLVSLSGPSFSRSWVGFDDDYFESSLADTNSNESNRKTRHYGDHSAWDSDEEYGDSEHQGFGYEDDRPNSSDEYHYYGPESEYSSHIDHGYHHGHIPGHRYQDKYGYNHGYYDNKDKHSQSGSNWGHKQPQTYETPGDLHHQRQYGDQNKKPETSTWTTIQNNLLYTKFDPNQGSGHYHGSHRAGSSNWQNSGIPGPNDADRVVFPTPNNQIPTTSRPTVTTTTRPSSAASRTSTTMAPTTTRPSTSTTRTTAMNTALLNLVLCIRACPTTPEYNPVCGSNNITYNNPGSLQCAKNCGMNVALARRAPCPRVSSSSTSTTTTTSTSTSRPSTTTSRPSTTTSRASTTTTRPNTTTGRSQTLIPLDLLLSIFGQPSANRNTAKQ